MKKIMIVDDEKVSLMMTEHILSTEYEIICATSGDEAISLYYDEQPDMILSDLHMPGMGGYDLQLFLQSQFQEKIPFMFMTADHDVDLESRGLENGAMDFIRKPFRADILLQRVSNILRTVEQLQGVKQTSIMDPMTGLLNKEASENKIGRACQNSVGALMLIDLDDFHLVNERFGQEMGDKMLLRISEIIESAGRSSDLVGRIDGDLFIAFCKNVSDEAVIARKAEYINRQIMISAKDYIGEELDFTLGASIGCVFVPEEGIEYRSLYHKAASALDDVKRGIKHSWHIYETDTGEEEGEEKTVSELLASVRAFSESGSRSGAYTLPNDEFKFVFRFLERYITNYKKEVWMLQFTVSSDSGDDLAAMDVTEDFLSVVQTSLRQSDVITQTSKMCFVVLLMETSKEKIKFVLERIMDNWEASGKKRDGFTIEHEIEIMQ